MMETVQPAKRSKTDYKLCVICQTDNNKKLVNTQYKTFKDSAFDNLLTAIHKKAEFGNTEYIRISNRLHNVTSKDLKEENASWHKDCQKKAINHIDRDQNRANKASLTNDVKFLTSRKRGRPNLDRSFEESELSDVKRITRNQTNADRYDKDKCIFCQEDNSESLVKCQSVNKGHKILHVVESSKNELWKVRVADVISAGDLLSKDIVYHKSCDTKNWEKFVQRPDRKTEDERTNATFRAENSDILKSLNYQAAEVQFYSLMQEDIDNGLIVTLSEALNRYEQTLSDFGFTHENESPYIFKSKLIEHLNNVTFTASSGNKPSLIHSLDTYTSAINKAADTQLKSEVQKLYDCAKHLRNKMKKSDCLSWQFQGSLQYKNNERPPNELLLFVNWLIHGPKQSRSSERSHEMNQSVDILSQIIVQNFKSDRQTIYSRQNSNDFYGSVETPLAIGLSLQSHHLNRSKNNIDILNAASVGVSYNRVAEITTQIANTAVESMNTFHGSYVPPRLFKGLPIRASADNVDKKVDTPDGQNSFHGTAMTVYQTVKIGETNEPVRGDMTIQPSTSNDTLKDIPETVVDLYECNIDGNPKPKTSPKYEHYKTGKHEAELQNAETQDMLWLLARYIHRNEKIEDENSAKPIIPVWRAYNSVITATDVQHNLSDQSHTLPIINSPAHEWTTLVTVLETLYSLNQIVCQNSEKLMVTFDMDLYKRALKLEFLNPDQFSKRWWLLPGSFHTSLCAVRCLGKTIECSGIDDMWIKSGVYGEVVVNQIINGNHYNRAIEAHEITLQVFSDLWMESFFESRPTVYVAVTEAVHDLEQAVESKNIQVLRRAHQNVLTTLEGLNLEKQLFDFDQENDKYPMYKWYRMYMRQVMVMLAFHRSIKNPDVFLYLSSLEKLATYFFAYNRLDYAQNILEFTARAYATQTEDHNLWLRLVAGEFAFSTRNIPFTSIGLDQAQEHQNKLLKGEGGISGITNKPTTFLKFCLAAPELSRISQQTDEMIGHIAGSNSKKHHLLNSSVEERHKNNINKLKTEINPYNPFQDKGEDLYNIMTKKVLRAEARDSILDTEKRGEDAKQKFVDDRINGETNLWDKMSKVKFYTWNDLNKRPKAKDKSKEKLVYTTTSLLSRMLVVAKSDRNLDLKNTVSNYEFLSVNHTIMNNDGTLLKCQNKSELIHALESLVNDTNASDQDETNLDDRHLIIDGMSIVQAIVKSNSKIVTCEELSKIFVHVVDCLVSKYYCGRVIFDNYEKEITIKDMIRYQTLDSEVNDIIIEDCTPLFGKYDILACNKTKDRLTIYLADKLIATSKHRIIAVTRQSVQSNSTSYQPITGVSSQEEADTLMVLHALEIANSGSSIDFYTQDTDWFVLLLRRHELLGYFPRIITGTKDSRRIVPLTPIYNALGGQRSKALPGMHALTGSDTTGHINGVGKKGALKCLMKCSDDVLSSLSQLGDGSTPSESVVNGCMAYLCNLMSSKKVNATSPAEMRWKRFVSLSSEQGVDKMPPTSGAWYQHILRAHLQANIWMQDIITDPILPDPLQLGWKKDNSLKLRPVLTGTQVSTNTLVELVKCNCDVSKCARRCKCKQNNLTCTDLCKCEASEECCNVNQNTDDIE